MKKIFSLVLLVAVFMGADTAIARTGNTNVIKASAASNDKAAAEPNAKSAKPENRIYTTGEDTSSNNLNTPFYKAKKKRNINLQDVYVGLGGGYVAGKGGNKAPFSDGITLNTDFGTPLINKYLLLEISNNAGFMFSPNMNWFSNAFSLPKSNIRGVGMGFYEEFSTSLQVVIAGSRKLTLTAGPVGGLTMNNLPSMHLNGSLYFITVPISFCYGMKAKLFVGEHFYGFAQYSNTLANKLLAQASAPTSEISQMQRNIAVDFGVLNIGIGYALKPWW